MSDSAMMAAVEANTNTIMNFNNMWQANSNVAPVAPQPTSGTTPNGGYDTSNANSAPQDTSGIYSATASADKPYGGGQQQPDQDASGDYNADTKTDDDGCCGCVIM
jgi:hypothetical protein